MRRQLVVPTGGFCDFSTTIGISARNWHFVDDAKYIPSLVVKEYGPDTIQILIVLVVGRISPILPPLTGSIDQDTDMLIDHEGDDSLR
jgi:hypothetical protein